MSNDIAARLRDIEGGYGFRAICREAADEIERLREKRDELQKWKDSQFTFWRDRAKRRDAIGDEIERLRNELAARCGDARPGAHTAGPSEHFIPEAL